MNLKKAFLLLVVPVFVLALSGCSNPTRDEAACQNYWEWFLSVEAPGAPPSVIDGNMEALGGWAGDVAVYWAEWSKKLDTLTQEAESLEIRRVSNAASDYLQRISEHQFPFAEAISSGDEDLAKALASRSGGVKEEVLKKHVDAISAACTAYLPADN